MAKKKRNPRRRKAKRQTRSFLTREQFYLAQHDEEKVLLFTTGIVLGVGIAASLLNKFLYGGLVALVVALILIFIESNQKYHGK